MLIRPEERDGFLHFVELNAALWKIEDNALDLGPDAGVVIVDLLSHDLHQTIRALYVGKILQRHLQCKIVALVGNLLFSRDLEFEYDKAEAVRLARSYGVDEFLDFEDAALSPSSKAEGLFPSDAAARAIADIRAAKDADLVDLVLGWQAANGCRVGEYIYETVLRIARNPFIADVREKLEEVTLEAFRIHNALVDFASTRRVEAITAGHISYTQWGMSADLVLRLGGRCVWFDCTGNFSAYLLTRPPRGAETLSGMIREIDRDLFEREFAERGRLDRRFIDKVQALFSSEYFLRPFWWEPTKSPPPAMVPALRKTALAKLGWQEADCPVICVFIHCLSDLPRDDKQIYLDYYVWVYETLKIAARNTNRKWMFKTHPANRGGYDVTNATERLKAEFKDHKHIFFLEDELEKVEVFALTDLAVTVRGSIAYEMSIFGKPALLAGHSVLSDLGFCHVAETEQDYARLLTSDLAQLALTPEMQARAHFYLIYDKLACRIESTFMPYWTYRLAGDSNIWYALSERILYNISDLDPVAPAIGAMLAGGVPRTLNLRYRELPAGKPERSNLKPPSPAELGLGDILWFGRELNGTPWLLTKPTRKDNDGSWFAADREAYFGFVLNNVAAARNDPLVLRVRVSGTPAGALLHVAANGSPVQRLPIVSEGTIVELGALGILPMTQDNVLVLRFWSSDSAGTRIYFRLDQIEVETSAQAFPPMYASEGLMRSLLKRCKQ